MRLIELLHEVIATTRSQKVTTVLVALLVAAMCSTTILTVGRTNAARAQVSERLDSAGSRELRVDDARGLGFLTASIVDQVNGFDTVERAVALTTPTDVTVAALGRGGTKVATWTLTGEMDGAVHLISGRWPQAGEALVSQAAQERLGLAEPVGGLTTTDGGDHAIVGRYRARTPFGELAEGVVVAGSEGTSTTLVVIVGSSEVAGNTQRAVLALLKRSDPSDLAITSPLALAQVQQQVSGDLNAFGRGLLYLVLGAGGVLVAVVVLSDILLHRRELGRRRALGATRWALTALVVARTTTAALIGAVVGFCVSGGIAVNLGEQPTLQFALGTAVLSILTAAIAAAPPAITAAFQDPVRVLRTP